MLTIQFIREHPEEVIDRLRIKNFRNTLLIDQIIAADDQRRTIQSRTNDLQAEMNQLSKEIGMLIKSGRKEQAGSVRERTTGIKKELESMERQLEETTRGMNELLVQVPNLPHPSVPPGKGEADNRIVRSGGTLPELHEKALPHWDLGPKYNLIDFDLGVKITGGGFPLYRGAGARLQRALISFFWMKTSGPDMRRSCLR